jgi:NADH:ubiquinone oxidoreductase subunit C
MADETLREAIHEQPMPATGSVAAVLVGRFPGSVAHEEHGQSVVYVSRLHWRDCAVYLRDEERFTQCVDITVVDHLLNRERLSIAAVTPERFEVVANYLSHPRNLRIRLIGQVPVEDPTIDSITEVYPGVDFAEREAYDLFGVRFAGHYDLTRILMPDDWVGYPLRKDDPRAAIPVAFKGNPT